MAYVLGIDVGSGYSKAVVCEDTTIRSFAVMPSGGDYKEVARTVAKNALSEISLSLNEVAYTVAAGYGAGMVDFADHSLTDISCHVSGIHSLFPSVQTVIDVGAQFTRAIRLDNVGRIANFILNEKCAGEAESFSRLLPGFLVWMLVKLGISPSPPPNQSSSLLHAQSSQNLRQFRVSQRALLQLISLQDSTGPWRQKSLPLLPVWVLLLIALSPGAGQRTRGWSRPSKKNWRPLSSLPMSPR